MNTWIVARTELAAALLFASQDETRFALNGVNIITGPNKKPELVATDGRVLAVIESSAEQPQESENNIDAEFLLSPRYIKAVTTISKQFGAKLFPWIQFSSDNGKRVTATLVGAPVTLDVEDRAKLEAKFPAWHKVIPEKTKARNPISEIALNPEMVGMFAAAGKLLSAPVPVIQMNLVGDEKCVEVIINGCENFYGILMQCRLDEDADYQPEFITIKKHFAADDAAAASRAKDIKHEEEHP